MTSTLHGDQYTFFFIISHSVLFRMRNVSHKSCRGNQNTHFAFRNFFFFWKSYRLSENMEKYCGVGQATGDSMAHAHCMPVTNATNTHSEYVTRCFCNTTMVTRTRINVTLNMHCLYCLTSPVKRLVHSSTVSSSSKYFYQWLVLFHFCLSTSTFYKPSLNLRSSSQQPSHCTEIFRLLLNQYWTYWPIPRPWSSLALRRSRKTSAAFLFTLQNA